MKWFWYLCLSSMLFGVALDCFVFAAIWPPWNIALIGLGVILTVAAVVTLKEALWPSQT